MKISKNWETEPQIYGQLNVNKDAKVIQRKESSVNKCWNTRIRTGKKMTLDSYIIICEKKLPQSRSQT